MIAVRKKLSSCVFLGLAISVLLAPSPRLLAATADGSLQLPRIADQAPRKNLVLILIDDLRFDALGYAGHPFLETPHIDRLAREGVRFTNAVVTTALCSPSRATLLTGQYAHRHRVVDNNHSIPPGTVFLSQYLQANGYATAFVGKWHMGHESDQPRPGFDHWVSFRGQGVYQPGRAKLNVNGQQREQQGYITDELTDYAVEWLQQRHAEKPFFLYLSHKAVHADFLPAERHRGRYANAEVPIPSTFADTPENYLGKPRWVKDQRNSWHGVDFAYHGTLDMREYYRRYCETLLAVDDSVGRVLASLQDRGVLDDTLVVFMGDNGFCFGEHGLIDKRCAYEPSMRVPLVARCPSLLPKGEDCSEIVANLDIAPTFLAAAGLQAPDTMEGDNWLPLVQGKDKQWRDGILYEYFWERNFPHTPTVHALRTKDYKYIHYHGIWDTDELYHLADDPDERHNLIDDPAQRERVQAMSRELFTLLEASGGMYIPLNPDSGNQMKLRLRSGATPGEFPAGWLRDKNGRE
jgi:N-acetylglucosamine-6-sulfatase